MWTLRHHFLESLFMARAVTSTATRSQRATTPHGDRRGSPRASERDQKVLKAEVCVAVKEQGDQVTSDEEEGESGQPAVHVEKPRRSPPPGEEIRGKHDPPEHRRSQHEPRYDPRGP